MSAGRDTAVAALREATGAEARQALRNLADLAVAELGGWGPVAVTLGRSVAELHRLRHGNYADLAALCLAVERAAGRLCKTADPSTPARRRLTAVGKTAAQQSEAGEAAAAMVREALERLGASNLAARLGLTKERLMRRARQPDPELLLLIETLV